jgi:hypothetical protein
MKPGIDDHRRVLLIRLSAFENAAKEQQICEWVQAELALKAEVIVLAANPSLAVFQGLDVKIWPDGATNGLLKLLGLVRRIAWGAFSDIYDLEMSARTRAYRWFVRPCPPWHSGPDLKPQDHKAP